ncbi:MAG: hypothetical protein SPJ13_01360 [Bacteroidales bacterium]|nr:hypothetical protein [Bacteroidales bacterium]
MTIIEILKGINAYPIPDRTLTRICHVRGLDPETEATQDVLSGKNYKLAEADILIWLSAAPNIAQGGQNYSFSDEQRQQLRNEAHAIIEAYAEEGPTTIYGYKGTRL